MTHSTLAELAIGPIQFQRETYLLLIPILAILTIFIARKSISGLGKSSRVVALVVRLIAITLIVAALAEPSIRDVSKDVGVTVIVDASRSIPSGAQEQIDAYIAQAQQDSRQSNDELGVITVAENAYSQASVSRATTRVDRQFIGATDGTNLMSGVSLAIASAPDNVANRIVLISDGNETDGSLLRAAQAAKAQGIPIDILPVEFAYADEVIVENVQVPANSRVGDTVTLKVVLNATTPAAGRLLISQDGTLIDINPADETELGKIVELNPGRNVLSVALDVTRPGAITYEAVFEPLTGLTAEGNSTGTQGDSITENNRGSAITFVGSEGTVLIVADDSNEAVVFEDVLARAKVATRRIPSSQFPTSLPELASYEGIVFLNQSAYAYSEAQQELLRQYIKDTGGGLVMVGGPESFGAGGWIGSPLADALPIRLDPPQKRQMPRGALALIVHSVEIPQGVFYGKEISNAAVDALSRLDLVGIIEYQGLGGTDWVYPMSPVGDRVAVKQAIQNLTFGDMPSFDPSLQLALSGLSNAAAGQKHCIVISDGDPSMSRSLLRDFKSAGITISAVGVNPHSPSDTNTLRTMANVTGGTYYAVANNALATLPQIFIKEAQTVRRALIWKASPSHQHAQASPPKQCEESTPSHQSTAMSSPQNAKASHSSPSEAKKKTPSPHNGNTGSAASSHSPQTPPPAGQEAGSHGPDSHSSGNNTSAGPCAPPATQHSASQQKTSAKKHASSSKHSTPKANDSTSQTSRHEPPHPTARASPLRSNRSGRAATKASSTPQTQANMSSTSYTAHRAQTAMSSTAAPKQPSHDRSPTSSKHSKQTFPSSNRSPPSPAAANSPQTHHSPTSGDATGSRCQLPSPPHGFSSPSSASASSSSMSPYDA